MRSLPQARFDRSLLSITQRNLEARKGLFYYLNQVTDDLENRIREGIPPAEAATHTLERKFIPEFEEFRRQELAKRVHGFGAIIDRFFEIDAGWNTPKFWIGLVRALFGTATGIASASSEQLTNKNLAFRFLARFHGSSTQH